MAKQNLFEGDTPKRYNTATVKAKILDTDQLSYIGLDMSELRCKDLANFEYFKEPKYDLFVDNNVNYLNVGAETVGTPVKTISAATKLTSSLPMKFARLRSQILNVGCSGFCSNINLNRKNGQQKNGLSTERLQTQASIDSKRNKSMMGTEKYFEMYDKSLGREDEIHNVPVFPKKKERNQKNVKYEKHNVARYINPGELDNMSSSETSNLNDKKVANQPANSFKWLSFVRFSNEDLTKNAEEEIEQLRFRQKRLHQCKFCGKEFGTAGIQVHQSRCEKV